MRVLRSGAVALSVVRLWRFPRRQAGEGEGVSYKILSIWMTCTSRLEPQYQIAIRKRSMRLPARRRSTRRAKHSVQLLLSKGPSARCTQWPSTFSLCLDWTFRSLQSWKAPQRWILGHQPLTTAPKKEKGRPIQDVWRSATTMRHRARGVSATIIRNFQDRCSHPAYQTSLELYGPPRRPPRQPCSMCISLL